MEVGAKCKIIGNIARLDVAREQRTGMPEVVLAEGKTAQQLAKILRSSKGELVISRIGKEHLKVLRKNAKNICYSPEARFAVINRKKRKLLGTVGIITGGTADIPVAEEAALMAQAMGCRVEKIYDAGVAGIHRLLAPLGKMMKKGVDVIVVAAGREGTLPAFVAGLVNVPVIGVPTSVGYGYGGKGESALKSMLQSCSFLTVVNIDNGVCAGACAAQIARRAHAG